MAIPQRRSNPANILAARRMFFVTSSIVEKRNLLQSDRSAKLLIQILYHYRSQGKFLLHGFVIMPDHFHVLISLGPEISIERAVQFIKGGFAFRAGKELGFKAPVWQRGFSEVRINDVVSLVRIHDYIAQNPVKRHLVQIPAEFLHSSSYKGFELDEVPQGLKPADSLLLIGRSKDVP